MRKNSILKYTLMLFLSVLGIFYYQLVQIEILSIKPQTAQFVFTVKSNIDQNVKLDIAAEELNLSSIQCNSKKIIFSTKEKQWFETPGEEIILFLQKGKNYCNVQNDSVTKEYRPIVKQKMMFIDYTLLFMLLGLPIFYILFKIFIGILHKIKKENINTFSSMEVLSKKEFSIGVFLILLFGMILRVIYMERFGIVTFQHDWAAHVELINYIAQNWTLPMTSKGLEFPQQPLYYIITGGLYKLLISLGLPEENSIYGLGYFSLFCSFIFLFYSYKFILLIFENRWARVVAMLFLSFTPTIVYSSVRINNDTLVMALSAFSLYYIVKSYQYQFLKSFFPALIGVSLLFMTKLSAASIEILFFTLLLIQYFKIEDNRIKDIENKIYWFGVVGIFLLGFTLLRVYLPIEGVFHMVNSTGDYPGQEIRHLDFEYFCSFHIAPLLQTGYSYVFGEDSIRYSFLTYQYGTMFFGEYNYSEFFEPYESVRWIMQAILFFGLIYLLGFISFIVKLYKASILEKVLFIALLINFLLILKYAIEYPSVCNTDFRYFAGSLPILAFVFTQGLNYIKKYRLIGIIVNIFLFLLFISEMFFYVVLLSVD